MVFKMTNKVLLNLVAAVVCLQVRLFSLPKVFDFLNLDNVKYFLVIVQ